MAKRARDELADLLAGRQSWADTSQAVRSWAQLPIYQAAKHMIKTGAMPKQVPADLRPMVEREARRLKKPRG